MINIKNIVQSGAAALAEVNDFKFGSFEELNLIATHDTGTLNIFMLPVTGKAKKTRHNNIVTHYNLSILVLYNSGIDDLWEDRYDNYINPSEDVAYRLALRIQEYVRLNIGKSCEIGEDFDINQQVNLFDRNMDGVMLEMTAAVSLDVSQCLVNFNFTIGMPQYVMTNPLHNLPYTVSGIWNGTAFVTEYSVEDDSTIFELNQTRIEFTSKLAASATYDYNRLVQYTIDGNAVSAYVNIRVNYTYDAEG